MCWNYDATLLGFAVGSYLPLNASPCMLCLKLFTKIWNAYGRQTISEMMALNLVPPLKVSSCSSASSQVGFSCRCSSQAPSPSFQLRQSPPTTLQLSRNASSPVRFTSSSPSLSMVWFLSLDSNYLSTACLFIRRMTLSMRLWVVTRDQVYNNKSIDSDPSYSVIIILNIIFGHHIWRHRWGSELLPGTESWIARGYILRVGTTI